MSTFFTHTRAGTTGGTLTILFANISSQDIVKTVLLAAIGAAVSFAVSVLLKYLTRQKRK